MMSRKFHRLRTSLGMALLAVLIALPFISIKGESAFRFDVPSLRLFVCGTGIGIQDFFIVLIAVFFITFLTLFITTLFGRIWCGWLCPQTVLVDLTGFMETGSRRGYAAMVGSYAAGILISAVISASLVGYFVSPYDAPLLLREGGTPARIVTGSWAAITLLLFLDLLFLRRRFCATVCPYAKMQGVLFDDRTMVVSFDTARAGDCMHCDACVKECPIGIDIRKGSQIACIHCAECVDACTERMKMRKLPLLIRYTFGYSGQRKAGLRINLLITGAVTAISLVFMLFLFWTRAPFDVTIRPAQTSLPHLRDDGIISNTYLLSFRNLKGEDLALELTAVSSSGTVMLTPSALELSKDADMMKFPVVLILRDVPPGFELPITITITVYSPRQRYRADKTFSVVMQKKDGFP